MAILLEQLVQSEVIDTVECAACGVNYVQGDSDALGADRFCSQKCEAAEVRPIQLPQSSEFAAAKAPIPQGAAQEDGGAVPSSTPLQVLPRTVETPTIEAREGLSVPSDVRPEEVAGAVAPLGGS